MKIKQRILEILSNVTTNANKAVITQKLDRADYIQVDQVLTALGGKWSRSAKAHVFFENAAPLIDAVIVTGEVVTHKDIGFFPTPEKLAKELVAMAGVKSGDVVLEPSAGTGRIVDALLDVGATVYAIERDDAMYRQLLLRMMGPPTRNMIGAFCGDFLTYSTSSPFDAVVMNPPFCKVGRGDHIDHVQAAFYRLRPGGSLVSVLPSGVTFRQDKRHVAFRSWVAEAGRGIITPLADGSFLESGTNVSTVVLKMVHP